MPDESEIRHLISDEFAKIVDPSRRAALESSLIPPLAMLLKWNYGKPGEQFQCWIVGLSPNGEERLVYCEKGFGPGDPWGYVRVAEDSMGMDSQWHVGLEHAAIGARILSAPPGNEVP